MCLKFRMFDLLRQIFVCMLKPIDNEKQIFLVPDECPAGSVSYYSSCPRILSDRGRESFSHSY